MLFGYLQAYSWLPASLSVRPPTCQAASVTLWLRRGTYTAEAAQRGAPVHWPVLHSMREPHVAPACLQCARQIALTALAQTHSRASTPDSTAPWRLELHR